MFYFISEIHIKILEELSFHTDFMYLPQWDDFLQAINAPNGKIAGGIPCSSSSSSSVNSRTPEANISEKKVDVQHKGMSEGESNPTLDRINL